MSHPTRATSSGNERSSSPLLFEDSQPLTADPSLEVLNDSKNDSKETNVDAAFLVDSPDTEGVPPQRPQQNLFSSQQRLIGSTPPQSPARKPRKSPSRSLSLSKNNLTSVRQLKVIEEDAPTDTPMDEGAESFGSLAPVHTPSKRKVSQDSDSDVEEVDKDKVEEHKRKRLSVEVVYQSSTPLRASSSPFRAADVSFEPIHLDPIAEEKNTADDFQLHFSPSQDVSDKSLEKISGSFKKLNNSFKDVPSSSGSDSNQIFELVNNLAAGTKSSPEDLDGSVTIVEVEKKDEVSVVDTLQLDSSPSVGVISSQEKQSSPEDIEPEEKKTLDKKKEAFFVLVKVGYTAGEECTIDDPEIVWQMIVNIDMHHDSRSSILSDNRSSTSPLSISSDDKVKPYPLPGPRMSTASSSSSSSAGSTNPPFAVPASKAAPRERKLATGAFKYLERNIILHKDPKISNQNFLVLKSSLTENNAAPPATEAPENKVVVAAEPPVVPDVPETPAVKASNGKSTRTSQRGRKKGSTSRKTPAVQPTKSSQRKKNDIPLEQHDLQELLSEALSDTPLSGGPPSTRGQPVFAMWSDMLYYSGVIGDRVEKRWEILFDDGARRSVLEEHVIAVETLPVGQPIHVTPNPSGDKIFPGIIIEHIKSPEGEVRYQVDLDEQGNIVVKKSQLLMNADQAQILRETLSDNLSAPTTPHRPDLSLDNLMDGKRGRSKRQLCMPESPRAAGSRASNQPGCSKDNDSLPVTDSAAEMAPWNAEWESLPGVENAAWPQLASGDSKNKTPGASKELENLGPFPKKNIFKDYVFCLNFSNGQDSESQSERDSEMESQDTEAERDRAAEIPAFNKIHLEKQLRKGGGTVVEFFEAHQLRTRNKCLLVTNRCSYTAKAVMCLALGVQSVGHKWVIACCEQEKLIVPRNYILPVGHSRTGVKVEWDQRPKNARPFSKHQIALVSNVGQGFLEFWGKVLSDAKAVRVISFTCEDFLRRSDMLEFDVIVTDSECTEELLEKARQLNTPLVRTSWVVQSLVCGRAVPLEHHSLLTQALSRVMQTF